MGSIELADERFQAASRAADDRLLRYWRERALSAEAAVGASRSPAGRPRIASATKVLVGGSEGESPIALQEFLNARLDDDERAARYEIDNRMHGGWDWRDTRMKKDLEFKRQVIADHPPTVVFGGALSESPALIAMAKQYSHHPQFREEWA